jgi:hypothetical protein
MKKNISILLVIISLSNTFAQTKIVAQKFNSKIDILINKNLFTSYILSEDEKYPFFFPVNGP